MWAAVIWFGLETSNALSQPGNKPLASACKIRLPELLMTFYAQFWCTGYFFMLLQHSWSLSTNRNVEFPRGRLGNIRVVQTYEWIPIHVAYYIHITVD